MDYLTIEQGGKDQNLLVIRDHFMHFAMVIPTPSQTAMVTAKALYDKFFIYFGFPDMILSDQGKNFTSDLIVELCKVANIKKL